MASGIDSSPAKLLTLRTRVPTLCGHHSERHPVLSFGSSYFGAALRRDEQIFTSKGTETNIKATRSRSPSQTFTVSVNETATVQISIPWLRPTNGSCSAVRHSSGLNVLDHEDEEDMSSVRVSARFEQVSVHQHQAHKNGSSV